MLGLRRPRLWSLLRSLRFGPIASRRARRLPVEKSVVLATGLGAYKGVVRNTF